MYVQADIWGIGVCLLTAIRELSKRFKHGDLSAPPEMERLPLGKLQESGANFFEHAVKQIAYCKKLHPVLLKLLQKDAEARPAAAAVVTELQRILTVRMHEFIFTVSYNLEINIT